MIAVHSSKPFSAFQLEFVVPDLLYERELRQHGGEDLRELGSRVEELDGPGVVRALGYRVREPSLSLVDSFGPCPRCGEPLDTADRRRCP